MRRTNRLLLAAALATASAVGIVGPVALTGTAAASSGTNVRFVRLNGFESTLVDDINKARRNAGLGSLTVVAGATDVARRWSWRMASVQQLSHNPSIVNDISRAGSRDWSMIAENVGEGPSESPDVLFRAYMASPEHRANILDRDARYIGMGTVERNGIAWNTMDFTNAYDDGYGRTRVPAAGLTMDSQPLTSTTDLAMLESGDDQRFATNHHGGLHTSRLSFTGPSARNDAAYTWVRQTSRTGFAGVMMRDALNLSNATSLRLQLSARSDTGNAVPVRVLLQRSFGSTVRLGTVHVSGKRQWFDLSLPSDARSFRNALYLRVTGNAVHGAGGRVRLAMYDLRAAV
jgi:uncharacterized protein YkwD